MLYGPLRRYLRWISLHITHGDASRWSRSMAMLAARQRRTSATEVPNPLPGWPWRGGSTVRHRAAL